MQLVSFSINKPITGHDSSTCTPHDVNLHDAARFYDVTTTFITYIDMAQYESNIKHIPYSQERVYSKLSDLSNLSSIKDRLDMIKEKLDGKLEDMSFDTDSITLKVQGFNLTLRIIEREPLKCIKFEGENTPIPLNLRIQILPESSDTAKMKVTIRAEVNMFMKAMVAKPLQEGVEKLADMLSMIPY